MTPIDQPFNGSAPVCHRRAPLNAFPLLRCRSSATQTARRKHNYPLMNIVDIYQLLLPGDNGKIGLPGVDLSEVLNWSTRRNLQWWRRLLAGNKLQKSSNTQTCFFFYKRSVFLFSYQVHIDAPQHPSGEKLAAIIAHPFCPLQCFCFQMLFFFILCNTFRPIWKKSCKHHQQPSGLHKAPFGRFKLRWVI